MSFYSNQIKYDKKLFWYLHKNNRGGAGVSSFGDGTDGWRVGKYPAGIPETKTIGKRRER